MFKYLDHSSPNMRTESPSRRRLKYQNMESLFDDLSSLTETPELCDVKFVVGKNKTPVYGVKSIISTRNRVLYSIILAQEKADIREKKMQNRNQSLRRKVQRIFSRIARGDKKQTANRRPRHLTVPLTEFDPDIFRRILDHVMSGTVTVDVNCVIAVMEAAAQFEIEDLREACYQFAQRHISLDNALQLLDCCELGWQSKWARCIKDQVLKFIAQNWKTIGRQEGLKTSSSKAFQAILATSGLQGSERSVSEAKLRWERHHGQNLFFSESCATTGNDSGVPVCGQSTESDFRISIDDFINQAELLQAASLAMGGNSNFCQESTAAHRCVQKSLSDTEAKCVGLGKFSKGHLMSASQGYISCMDNAFMCSSLDISSLMS